jgi:hypothetical protein
LKKRHGRVYQATGLADANKELNFLNFVRKVEDTQSVTPGDGNISPSKSLIINSLTSKKPSETKLPEIKPISGRTSENNEVVKEVKIVAPEETKNPVVEVVEEKPKTNFNDEKSYLSYESYRTEKVINCMHDEIMVCECCRFPTTAYPMVSMNQFENVLARRLETSMNEPPRSVRQLGRKIQGEDDAENIFHLTTTNEAAADKADGFRIAREKSDIQVNQDEVYAPAVESSKKSRPKLRDILIANYDAKLATKIGVGNFVPIEVLNTANTNRKDLDFIPFENIDQSYPRINGQPVFNSSYSLPKRHHRTNPSIPRPESKHGTRSAVYEQIIELKRQTLDPNSNGNDSAPNFEHSLQVNFCLYLVFQNLKKHWWCISQRMCT